MKKNIKSVFKNSDEFYGAVIKSISINTNQCSCKDVNIFTLFYLFVLILFCSFQSISAQTFQAENGSLFNGAAIQNCGSCSGGNQVGNLGGPSKGYFTTVVNTAVAGTYSMDLSFSSGDPRSIFMSVNNGNAIEVICNSGDWGVVGTISLGLLLNVGNNSIKFFNDNGYGPNIDKFELQLQQSPNPFVNFLSFETENSSLFNGADIQNCGSCSEGKQVGNLGGPSNGYFTTLANVSVAGTYAMNLSFSSGDSRSIFISVNSGSPVEVVCNSGSWSVVGTTNVSLNLSSGDNTIRFFNESGYAPNIDKFDLLLQQVTNPFVNRITAQAESSSLFNGASIQNCASCSEGKQVGNIGGLTNGYFTKVVNVSNAGTYTMDLSFSSGDPRSIFISVNDGIAKELICNSGNWSVVGVDSIELTLNAGNNILKFFNSTGFGPNIDKFELKLQSGPNPSFTFGSTGKINYNLENGTASVLVNNKLIISEGYAEMSNGTSVITSKQYASRVLSKTPLNDGYGSGEKIVVTLSGNGLPMMEQIFYTYSNKEYFLTELVLKGANAQSNYMAPMISTNVRIYSEGDNRMLFVPFDNDTFIRYNSKVAQSNASNTSSEVSAFYENNSRNGLVVGSVEHAAWKTGVKTTGTGGALSELKVWGGYTAVDVTRDVKSHGTLTGTNVKSPKIFIGLYDDWRQGMEDYGKANLIAEPTYLFDWDKPTPLGWNSWGVIQQNLTLENAKGVADFVSNELPVFRNGDTAFINLDSYWDNLVTGGLEGNFSKLTEFVQHCKSKGLKPGIYWAPFMDFGKFDRRVEGSTFNYINAWTRVNGGYHDLDGGRALDPTHPATKERINLVIDKFKASGFEMIKIDFIGHAAIEADSYFDPQIKTGMQAFHHGMKYMIDRLENKMLVYLAISPSLASGPYGHMRRIATDAFASIDDTQYTLNSTTYGWWQNQIYDYLDADHLVFKNVTIGENRARLVSGLVTGTVTTGDDFSTTGTWSSVAKQLLQNKEILKIAAVGKAFRPVEGNSTQDASEVFVKQVGNSYYVGILNYGLQKTFNISLQRLGIANGNHSAKELFSSNQFFLVGNTITVTIGTKDAQFLKINTEGTFTYYADSDGDSYGAGIGIELSSLTAPSGYSLNSDDCDDTNAAINPNITEIFDTIDNDCDGSVDEGTSLPSSLTFCKGATVATVKGTTDLQLYTSTLVTAVALLSTTALSSRVYYATLNGSARTAVTVTVNPLPTEVLGAMTSTIPSTTTTTGFVAATTKVGQYVKTTTPISYRIPAFTGGGLSYLWTVPTEVTIVGSADTNVLTVHYYNVAVGVGTTGAIKVQAVNTNGCAGTAKSITVSKVLPTAPSSITMTNAALPIPATAITTFAPYMGTSTELTLTAKPSSTATSYVWELPEGVNVTNGSATTTEGVTESTSNVITVNFSGVTSSNTYNYFTTGAIPVLTSIVRIGAKAKNGVGVSVTSNATLVDPTTTSTARLLTLKATLPAAPSSLKMYNLATSSTVAVTDISTYINTDTQLTLTATASKLASSYSWEIPSSVTIVEGSDLTSKSIKVTFKNVPAGTTSLYLGVKAVNRIGNGVNRIGNSVTNNSALTTPATSSTAKLLKVIATAPSTPVVTGNLKICPSIASSDVYTIATVASKATSYVITLSEGATIGGNSTATIPAVANATFTVNYATGFIANTTTAIKSITITSVNGFGNNLTNRVLKLNNTGATCLARVSNPSASAFSVKAYPNPSSSEFTIETSAKGAMSVKVYDMQGRLVEKANTDKVGAKLATGTYNIIVNQGTNTKSVRVIKK